MDYELQPRKYRTMKTNHYTIVEIRKGLDRYCRNLNLAYWTDEEMMREELRALQYMNANDKPLLEWWVVTQKLKKKRVNYYLN